LLAPSWPCLRLLVGTVHGHLDREHTHVHQGGPETTRKEAYEGAEQTHKQPHTRNHEEPSVRHGFERFDLVSERQQLLRDTETETELWLPVHNSTRGPADQPTQRIGRTQAKDMSCV